MGIILRTVLVSLMGGLLFMTHAWADSQSEARKALEAKHIPVSEGEFLRQIERGDKTVVDLFLQAGINANSKDDAAGSALTIASVSGHADIARMLLAKGADVHAKNKEGVTPLMGAIMGRAKEKGSGVFVDRLVGLGRASPSPIVSTPKGRSCSVHTAGPSLR